MQHILILVLVALAAAAAEEEEEERVTVPEDEGYATTLDDVFLELFQINTYEILLHMSITLDAETQDVIIMSHIQDLVENINLPPFAREIILTADRIRYDVMTEFGFILGNVPVQSIYNDLNVHCADHLQTPITNLTDDTSDVPCVTTRLRSWLKWKLQMAVAAGLQKSSLDCHLRLLPLCTVVPAKCTMAYAEQTAKLLIDYIGYATEPESSFGSTPLEIITLFIFKSTSWVSIPYISSLQLFTFFVTRLSSFKSFPIKPAILSNFYTNFKRDIVKQYTTIQSQEHLGWGIVKSDVGSVDFICSYYRDIYSPNSEQYLGFEYACCSFNIFQSTIDLMRCAYTDTTLTPLALSTVPSAYFHSQCLCLAYNGTDCGVKPPQGVDPRHYCLSVLLRDFQRQVWYRPAVTYLDYAYQTRVPVCQLTLLLKVGFRSVCDANQGSKDYHVLQKAECYLKDLVNVQFNCSERLLVNTYNETELCALQYYLLSAACDGDADANLPVPYYRAGDSPLVLFLTYGDVVVRVLTIVTYLACKQLRNLPGKLLVAYLMTALLRLVVVRATLADMAMAVRLDVALDLSSTLWLTAYLHFLTVSIRDLRPPDSLSRGEARTVLLRYSLLGWVLPLALSTAFFWMDEAIDSPVQIGQLLFLLCNYMALFGNLYMFFKNCTFYYEVKNSARKVKQGERKRDVFAAIFNFAIKTAVLSGAGITFRLVFTQIQGLELLLGYYHALGTLQGLLVFLLYGCNHEARAFWLQVVRSTLPCFRRRPQNAPV